MHTYKALKNKQYYSKDTFEIVPIRMEDRHAIRKWRNEQIYHLRQTNELTIESQDAYFNSVIAALFQEEQPKQILFSFLKEGTCIGYGGLVHINWVDRNAEVSFLMDTEKEKEYFGLYWSVFLELIQQVAFLTIGLHKIFTYAFDVRPQLYPILEKARFTNESVLKEHCLFYGEYKDVYIHSRISSDYLVWRKCTKEDVHVLFEWTNDKAVRENSFIKEPVLWDDHVNWFAKLLTSENELYILDSPTCPIGMIRFDKKDGFYLLNYSVDSKFRGLGFGKKIVMEGISFLKQDNLNNQLIIHAHVKPTNISSVRIFRALEFTETNSNQDNSIHFITIV